MDALTNALSKSHLSLKGLSFAGKGLKLDNEESTKEIVEAINKCPEMNFLNLEGNTLGIEAAKAIAKALESHSEFKQALWKDLFTGRMKDEIPIALQHLGDGLLTSGARLTELDLSDNAFGPIGVKGLASFLRSSACYALQELKLNNNGLGIGGAKLLASALLDCYNMSKESGSPLSLKVFIAGRNRLENIGATALAEVFQTIGTLEEIQMPQNGIYHPGFAALSEALEHNKNLQILNFNDNTIGPIGAKSLAKVLPLLKQLKIINFGDCLLKTNGANAIATCLSDCIELEELILDSNEIRVEAAKKIIEAISDKKKIRNISLNNNCFGEDGVVEIKELLKKSGKLDCLDSLSDDEGDDGEEEVEDEEDEKSGTEDDVNNESAINISHEETLQESVSVEQFLQDVSPEKFIALGDKRTDLLLKAATSDKDDREENFLNVLMKTSSIANLCKGPTIELLRKCCEHLYMELFKLAHDRDNLPIVNNLILIHLDLIKCEDKKFKITWNLEGCLIMLEHVITKNYFPNATKETLKLFLKRDVDKKDYGEVKERLLSILK